MVRIIWLLVLSVLFATPAFAELQIDKAWLTWTWHNVEGGKKIELAIAESVQDDYVVVIDVYRKGVVDTDQYYIYLNEDRVKWIQSLLVKADFFNLKSPGFVEGQEQFEFWAKLDGRDRRMQYAGDIEVLKDLEYVMWGFVGLAEESKENN